MLGFEVHQQYLEKMDKTKEMTSFQTTRIYFNQKSNTVFGKRKEKRNR